MNIEDCLIIGGGPAGLSAAIYLARFMRQVAVIDRGSGRTNTYEINENYLGFPDGIAARELVQLGKRQAERFGTRFIDDDVQAIAKGSGGFEVTGSGNSYRAKTLILATGVTDLYPDLPGFKEFLGKTLFWCITCDGYKTRGKKVVIVGDTDEAACDALQFLLYTPHITLVTNYPAGENQLTPKWKNRLSTQGIQIVEGVITQLQGNQGMLEAVGLDTGQKIDAEILINEQGAVPNNALATELGVAVDPRGYVLIDAEQRTNVPFVYAAGDLTGAFSHQIVTAAHEGSMAAQAANYDLYEAFQRME
jgi:thioredoxin reductase (NADPH)